jgi:hypothetical protein
MSLDLTVGVETFTQDAMGFGEVFWGRVWLVVLFETGSHYID